MPNTYRTDISKHRYPGIARAALEMAYDNGGVNRDRPESVTINELDAVLAAATTFDLDAINRWLADISYDELTTAVAGEHCEAQGLIAKAPPGTDDLLNMIFEAPG